MECKDINECEQTPDPCDGEFEFCENEPGSFSCSCVSAGFHRPSQESSCGDIDECSNNDANCRSDSEKCLNQIGSYTCECKLGFSKNFDLGWCEDVDECDSIEPCTGPFDTCLNEEGSFSCPCVSGFERKTEDSLCEDIDECKSTCNGAMEVCENEDGSFTCGCITGYRWKAEENTCIELGLFAFFSPKNPDIYPCESFLVPCISPLNLPIARFWQSYPILLLIAF